MFVFRPSWKLKMQKKPDLQKEYSKKTQFFRHHVTGFTLIEILLVIALIAILAGIVILAINPNKQLADGRNTQRRADVNTILNAIYQYAIDNHGNLPASIPLDTNCGTATTAEICQTGSLLCTG